MKQLILVFSLFMSIPAQARTPLDELKLIEGDEQGNEVRSLKAEMMVRKSEENAIFQARKLLRKHRGTDLEPEIQFRLAELYMRRSKTDRFFELHRESDTVVRLAPRLVSEASSKASVQKAVEMYSLIQSKWPGFAQMDLVIFNHAFARQTLGQEKESEGLYAQLIGKHSTSPLVPDAHLAIGEMAFNRGQFQVALDHFNATKRFPESRVFPYGLYKAAWTHYNMRNAEMGLRKLEEVVAYGKFVEQNRMEARLDLRKEALVDMTLFYEDVYPSKDAYRYFLEQAGDAELAPILLRMGTLYERHSRFNDQRIILSQFIDKLPMSPLIPKVHTDLILAMDALKQKDDSVRKLEELQKICQPSSRWTKALAGQTDQTKKLTEECLTGLTETSLRLARKWLRAWKKLPDDTTYADASEKAFQVYLRIPAKSEEFAQSRFAYAELLFARRKYRQASEEYAAVSRSGMVAKLSHDAAYAAVVSLEKAVGEKWSNDDEHAFNQLAREYVEKYPQGQHRLDLEYKMALLAYEKERYAEAAPVFLRLGREFPKSEKGMKAQDLYLDILNIKKDYRAVRDYAQEVRKSTVDGARDERLRKLYERAYFLEIQGMEEKGRLKEALAEYQTFAAQNSGSDLAEKSIWNAIQLHFKLGDFWGGAKSAEDYAGRYPRSSNAVNSLLRAAQTFEQMGQLTEAAGVLVKLSVKDQGAALRWKELAADFYALDDRAPEARKIYHELRGQVDQAQKIKIIGKLEALEKNYGNAHGQAEVQKHITEMNIQPQASQIKVEAVEQKFEKGRHQEAFDEARRLLGSSQTNANQKARLRLVQAKVLEQEFLKQSVKSKAERVGTVLAIKTEKLQKAQEAFQATIRYGDPRASMEAFERLYGCYAHYVKALKEMPVPGGLSTEDEKVFRSEIGNLVVPLEEKSVDSLAQAVQFARNQPFLDGTVARLERELNRLNHQTDVNPELEMPGLAVPVLAGVGP
jgi:TolA-binding protein